MRQDVFVANDSGGMSLLSSSIVQRVIEDGREDDEGFVKRHQAILGLLAGDDSFIARVVAGEPLTEDEQSQWIAHYRWALDIPCGKLLVCGGFDPGILEAWQESGEHSDVRSLDVPPGKYLVDVYTYLHSMNGRVILGDVWRQKLGAWFRRSHPGRAFPSWVAGELAMFNDEDPGHEGKWEDLAGSVKSGALDVETEPLDWVGFLIHLQPFDPKARLSRPEEGGWFGAELGLRRPKILPLGLAAVGARDPEYHEALAPLTGETLYEEEPAQLLDVWSQVKDRKPVELPGGPVAVAVKDWLRLFRIAWLATTTSHPELRIEGPKVHTLANAFSEQPGLEASLDGQVLSLRFEVIGPRLFSRLRKYPPETWAWVPEGSTLELLTCPTLADPDPELGLLRFRGKTHGAAENAVWEVQAAYPAISADTLRSALRLTAAAESDSRLVLDSPEEARLVHKRFLAEYGFLLADGNQALCKGNEIRFKNADENAMHFLAATAFQLRFTGVWRMETLDEE
jgi:hypothetical protein